jgi:hypothetical protein
MSNLEKIRKTISISLQNKLNKLYPPSSRIDDQFRGIDITFITNERGEVMHLYIGRRMSGGDISGEHYVRQVKQRENNAISKSHWDNKGKVSGK